MAVLKAFGEPLLSSSLIWPGETEPMHDADDIAERFGGSLEVFLDSGHYGMVPTTVIDLTSGEAEVIREGAGSLKPLTIDAWTKTGIQVIAVYALPVIFAITLHEAAHGWMAQRLGDPTAEQLGRISLNPGRHVDPVGTLLVPGLTLALGGAMGALCSFWLG